MAPVYPFEARSQPVRQTLGVPPKRLLGPARRQPPRLDDERTERTGRRARRPRRARGRRLDRWRARVGDRRRDHPVAPDGDHLHRARARRSAPARRGAGRVRAVRRGAHRRALGAGGPAPLPDVGAGGGGAAGHRRARSTTARPTRRGSAPRCSTGASSSTPTCAAPTSTARASPARRSGGATSPRSTCQRLALRAGVAPRVDRRPAEGRRVAPGPARSAAISSCRWRCRSWRPAGITVDDDAPDLVDGD